MFELEEEAEEDVVEDHLELHLQVAVGGWVGWVDRMS